MIQHNLIILKTCGKRLAKKPIKYYNMLQCLKHPKSMVKIDILNIRQGGRWSNIINNRVLLFGFVNMEQYLSIQHKFRGE
ncbi:MAG: hypothetical protein C3F13_15625 [Anaerolineales bacterium]|nr:MAG: hypothetical protein C3F13_15625 [Anaerolineales bacterium]